MPVAASILPAAFALPVDPRMRERAIDLLQERYAQGIIGHVEFTERMGLVLQAATTNQMDAALVGLGGASAVRPPLLDTSNRGRTGRLLGTVAHASALGSWIIGPAVVHMVSPKDSWAQREAAKSFNFQLLCGVLFLATMTAVNFWPEAGIAVPIGAVLWLISTLVGALRAANGELWRHPLMRVLPVRVLDEGPRPPRRRALGH